MKTGVLGGWLILGVVAIITACGGDRMTGPGQTKQAPGVLSAEMVEICVSFISPTTVAPSEHVFPPGAHITVQSIDAFSYEIMGCFWADNGGYDPYELCTEMTWYLPHCIGDDQPQMLIGEGGGGGGGGSGGGGGNEGGGSGNECPSGVPECWEPLRPADLAWFTSWKDYLVDPSLVPEEHRQMCYEVKLGAEGIVQSLKLYRGAIMDDDPLQPGTNLHSAELDQVSDRVHIDGDLWNAALSDAYARKVLIAVLLHEGAHWGNVGEGHGDLVAEGRTWYNAEEWPFNILTFEPGNPCVNF